MNFEFIRHLLPSIRKKKNAVSMMPIMMCCILLVLVFMQYVYRKNMIVYRYEDVENALISSLLAGGIVNTVILGKSGDIVIAESLYPNAGDSFFPGSYLRFMESMGNNLPSDLELGEGLKVNEYRVYNYVKTEDSFLVTLIGYKNGNIYLIPYNEGQHVYVKANDTLVDISETSVYASVSFPLKVMGEFDFFGKHFGNSGETVELTRLVGIKN